MEAVQGGRLDAVGSEAFGSFPFKRHGTLGSTSQTQQRVLCFCFGFTFPGLLII